MWRMRTERVVGRAAGDEFQRLGRVDGRAGVGAGDDRGDAARGRGEPGRAEAFAVSLARLADLDAEIDDSGREASAAAVDDRRALGRRPVARDDQAAWKRSGCPHRR